MKLLVLGGTEFVGRHAVQAALARGHEVTLFNRGLTNPALFPGAEHLWGDRETQHGLAALSGRRWDAALDTCGYVPRVVGASADALVDAVEHYTYISSLSVYPDERTAGLDESAPVAEIDDPPPRRSRTRPTALSNCTANARSGGSSWTGRSSSGPGTSSARTIRPIASPTGPTGSPAAARCWPRMATGCR